MKVSMFWFARKDVQYYMGNSGDYSIKYSCTESYDHQGCWELYIYNSNRKISNIT